MNIRILVSSFIFIFLSVSSSISWAEKIVLAVPGPGTLSYMPVYLAKAIAADQAEDLDLELLYVHGGPVAMRDLQERNADFASVGLAAVAAARADGLPVVAIGQLSQTAMYVFMLRKDLAKEVRKISQLKGKRIGSATSTSSSRSMGHMMLEYLLQRAGLNNKDVQFVSIGQNRATQSAALKSGEVDAIMGDEPFASELIEQNVAVPLADLYLPKESDELLGGPVVHAALITREDVLKRHPETVKKVLRMYDRTLKWMVQHTPQEVIAKLADQPGFKNADKQTLVKILERNEGMYPKHVKWDEKAVDTTEKFFHSTALSQSEKKLKFSDFVKTPPQ